MLIFQPRADLRNQPIETERLILHPVEGQDGLDLWYAVHGSRATLARWLPWVQYHTDQNASVRFAEACAADWDQGRALRFAIRDRENASFLGIVGLEQCAPMHRSADLGYWLRNEVHHRGIMTEAARACIDFAFRRMVAHRVKVAAGTENFPSLRVISRLGFRFEGIARQAEWCDGRWLDHATFARLATD